MTQIGQRSLDSPIPPTAVFFRHAHHQILDLRRFSRSAAAPFATAIIFLRDQPAMPGQQGLGRDNRSHLSEMLASQSLGPGGYDSRVRHADYTDKCSDTGCALCHYGAM